MNTEAPYAPTYTLICEKRAAQIRHGVYERDKARYDRLPDYPTTFRPMTGSFANVEKRARELNEVQIRSSYLDYLYSPDLLHATRPPKTEEL